MKHFFTCIFLICLLSANAQNPVSSINITMPSQMPAQISEWHSSMPPVAITAQIRPDSTRSIPKAIIDSKILVTIKNGDSKICGSYNPKTAPNAEFSSLVKNWRGADVDQLIGESCTLKPGSYTLCVQFFSSNGQAVSDERCKPFSVKNDSDPSIYQQPQCVVPANGSSLNDKTSKQPIAFRWTPVIPKPKESVIYKLQVWQYDEGKPYMEAIKTVQPIFSKDIININQVVITDLMNSNCKPAFNCNFVWLVQAVDAKGNALGQNSGTSEPFTFKTNSNRPGNDSIPSNQKSMGGANTEFKIDSAICLKKENGQFKYHIWAHYSNGVTQPSTNNVLLNDNNVFAGYPANPNPPNNVNKLNLANNIRMKSGAPNMALTMNDILEASSGTINVASITPSPASASTPASLAPNSILNFQFDYSTPTNAPVQFTYYGLVDDGLGDKPNRNTRNEFDSLKYPACPCSACDEITIKAPVKGSMQNNGIGSLSFTAALSAGPKKVKRIKADLVYFDMLAQDENCLACNKASSLFGNISTATTNNSGFSGGATSTHTAQFDAAGNVDISNGIPINFGISIPPLVACCNAALNFCIRYTITFDDCTVCNVLVCYADKIAGCQK